MQIDHMIDFDVEQTDEAPMGARSEEPTERRNTRAVPRVKLPQNIVARTGNGTAWLVDVSKMGAQILSDQVLRPNQPVCLALERDQGVVRIEGTVAWSRFEPDKETAHYRAGVKFKLPTSEDLSHVFPQLGTAGYTSHLAAAS